MALIPSSIGLIYEAIVLSVFMLMMIWFPQWFLEAYKINLTTTPATEKLMLTSFVQYIGLNYAMGGALNVITARQGNDSSKATINVINALWSLICAIITLGSYKYWTDIGVPSGGIWLNTCLFLLGAVLNLLGCIGSNVFAKLAPIGKPLYWGFYPTLLITTLYMCAMFFFPGALMKGYGVAFSPAINTVFVGLMRFGMAPYYIYTILGCIANFFIEPNVTYIYVRWLAIMMIVLSTTYCITAATWRSMQVNNEYLKIIRGQYFNAFLFLFFFVLFYLPVALMDGGIKGAVLGALGLKAGKEDAREDPENGFGTLADEEEEEDDYE